MPLIVALDLETTGLDPAQDAVIEIGAVKFSEKRVEGEYSKLINPRKPISSFITNLTGITNSMVLNAPLLINALPELVDFIGDAPILGQNIGFDMAFLQKAGALRANPTLDTYELASVLMPSAARYNLGALASQLGVFSPPRTAPWMTRVPRKQSIFSCWSCWKSSRLNSSLKFCA